MVTNLFWCSKKNPNLYEISFVEHLLDSLLEGAKCVVIVPQSSMTGKTKEEQAIKTNILNKKMSYQPHLWTLYFVFEFVTPAVAAVGIFAIAAIPALPVVLAAGGTLAVATVMGHSTEIVEAARRHKLNKLAK